MSRPKRKQQAFSNVGARTETTTTPAATAAPTAGTQTLPTESWLQKNLVALVALTVSLSTLAVTTYRWAIPDNITFAQYVAMVDWGNRPKTHSQIQVLNALFPKQTTDMLWTLARSDSSVTCQSALYFLDVTHPDAILASAALRTSFASLSLRCLTIATHEALMDLGTHLGGVVVGVENCIGETSSRVGDLTLAMLTSDTRCASAVSVAARVLQRTPDLRQTLIRLNGASDAADRARAIAPRVVSFTTSLEEIQKPMQVAIPARRLWTLANRRIPGFRAQDCLALTSPLQVCALSHIYGLVDDAVGLACGGNTCDWFLDADFHNMKTGALELQASFNAKCGSRAATDRVSFRAVDGRTLNICGKAG